MLCYVGVMEPIEYFKNLKTNLKDAELEMFQKQMKVISEQIILSKQIGQDNLLNKLSFTYKVIAKEQQAFSAGYTKYLLKDEILKFLNVVKPKNSVKIIELKRYPRPIPMDALQLIDKAQKLEIFDDFFVVFTDFTDNNYESEKDKEMIQRNRDPVVFGWFKNDIAGFKHDRMYLIADWIDDHCDLDFSRLIEKMSEHFDTTVGNIVHSTIDITIMENIDDIVDGALENLEKNQVGDNSINIISKKSNISIWEKFINIWKK